MMSFTNFKQQTAKPDLHFLPWKGLRSTLIFKLPFHICYDYTYLLKLHYAGIKQGFEL